MTDRLKDMVLLVHSDGARRIDAIRHIRNLIIGEDPNNEDATIEALQIVDKHWPNWPPRHPEDKAQIDSLRALLAAHDIDGDVTEAVQGLIDGAWWSGPGWYLRPGNQKTHYFAAKYAVAFCRGAFHCAIAVRAERLPRCRHCDHAADRYRAQQEPPTAGDDGEAG